MNKNNDKFLSAFYYRYLFDVDNMDALRLKLLRETKLKCPSVEYSKGIVQSNPFITISGRPRSGTSLIRSIWEK